MIQRIQSVFLFLAFLSTSLLFVFPIADFVYPEGKFVLYITGLYQAEGEMIVKTFNTIAMIILTAASALLSIITIFRYTDRKQQIKLGRLNLILYAALLVLLLVNIDKANNIQPQAVKSYSFGIVLPVISLIFIWMANKAIKKDEDLVRSADRIR